MMAEKQKNVIGKLRHDIHDAWSDGNMTEDIHDSTTAVSCQIIAEYLDGDRRRIGSTVLGYVERPVPALKVGDRVKVWDDNPGEYSVGCLEAIDETRQPFLHTWTVSKPPSRIGNDGWTWMVIWMKPQDSKYRFIIGGNNIGFKHAELLKENDS